jgi:hypothetical protein
MSETKIGSDNMNKLGKFTVTSLALISLGIALPGGAALGQEKKGTTPYVTHWQHAIFGWRCGRAALDLSLCSC